jgi:hypothetical protein
MAAPDVWISRCLKHTFKITVCQRFKPQGASAQIGLAVEVGGGHGFLSDWPRVGASLERQFDKERSNVTGNDGAIAVEKGTDLFRV